MKNKICSVEDCGEIATRKGMCQKHYRQVKKHGRIIDENKPKRKDLKNRIGEEKYSNQGILMRIIKYDGHKNVIVEFQDEYKTKVKCKYNQFDNGNLTNPYCKTIFNVGYLGQGEYKSKDKNGKHTEIYRTWYNMLQRCYDPYTINKDRNLTYIDVYVCEEWHNFQNFAKWWEENYYEIPNEKINLDKDILVKGNKVYSPKTCIVVPQRINKLFCKRQNDRGTLPIGCSYSIKNSGNYYITVYCSIYINNKSKQKYLGSFPLNRPFQAFTCYKNFKEKYIKEVADEYKDLIPQKLYDALYKYEVEIND